MKVKILAAITAWQFKVIWLSFFFTRKQIGQMLYRSPHTIKTIMSKVYKHFAVHKKIVSVTALKDGMGFEIITHIVYEPKPNYTTGQLKLDLRE